MSDQPGLFDLPAPEVAVVARAGRGRSRETFSRTVFAEMTVQDARALRAAALRVLDEDVIVISEIGEPSDAEDDLADLREGVDGSALAALEWCLAPTVGMWPLLEADAVRIVALEVDLEEPAQAQIRARWTVTIKIRDASVARELALAACPAANNAARAEIQRSFAAVWHWAAEPYAPVTEIPGVAWTPVGVSVEQIFTRPR